MSSTGGVLGRMLGKFFGLMINLGILVVFIGIVVFGVAWFNDPTAEPKCDETVMKPGDVCVNHTSGTETTYSEAKERQEENSGRYIGPILIGAGAAAAIAGWGIGSLIDRRTGADRAAAAPPPPLPPVRRYRPNRDDPGAG